MFKTAARFGMVAVALFATLALVACGEKEPPPNLSHLKLGDISLVSGSESEVTPEAQEAILNAVIGEFLRAGARFTQDGAAVEARVWAERYGHVDPKQMYILFFTAEARTNDGSRVLSLTVNTLTFKPFGDEARSIAEKAVRAANGQGRTAQSTQPSTQ